MFIKKIVASFLLSLLILSCSGSQDAIEYSYQYLNKKRQDAYTEVYNYRYKIGADSWRDIEIYVKNEKFTYIITMERYFGHTQNRYVYNSLITPKNFTSDFRKVQSTVNSVQEAIELALSWYIEDIKSVEVPEKNIKYD